MKKVKGIIKVEVTSVPEGTQLVAIAIDDKELGSGADYTFLSKTNGKWSHMVDTTEYSNGLYNIGVSAGPDGDSPPSAYATGQIIIEN